MAKDTKKGLGTGLSALFCPTATMRSFFTFR